MKWKPLGEQHGGDATSMIVVSQEVIVEVGISPDNISSLKVGRPRKFLDITEYFSTFRTTPSER